ncbi:MAG: hypothetical protein KIS80_07335 [Anaerolineales bacterium]|nr:hypothetical protein [Anaerolineales bacterium]
MEKWDYTIAIANNEQWSMDTRITIVNGFEFPKNERPLLYDFIRLQGNEGWELIGFYKSTAIFKRPFPY